MDFDYLRNYLIGVIEYDGIRDVAKEFGIDVEPDKPGLCAADIREELTKEFHGCFPYEDENEQPCYLGKCDYGCENCPMNGTKVVEYNPQVFGVETTPTISKIWALIASIKMEERHAATMAEIEKVIEVIRRGEKMDKKIAENVSELTLIAYELKEKADGEFDSRVIFDEIYDLAVEFEKVWEILERDKYEPDYLTEIDKFGRDRLSKFFGIERKFYGRVAPLLRFSVDATSEDEAGEIVVQKLRSAGFDVSDSIDTQIFYFKED